MHARMCTHMNRNVTVPIHTHTHTHTHTGQLALVNLSPWGDCVQLREADRRQERGQEVKRNQAWSKASMATCEE